ncbi:amino acid permease [Lentzea indica]|nr:amino acid permease [Lentzea indica]
MISLGGAIGTGLFLGSSLAITKAGPAVVLVYLAAALVAVALAYALAEMVVVHPHAGGFGAVTNRYLGPFAGYLQRWSYWAAQVVTVGGEVVAAGLYVRFWWPQVPLWAAVSFFAVVVVVVNLAAVKLFGEVEYWFSAVKVFALVMFVVLGAAYVAVGLPGRDAVGLSAWTDHGGFAPNGLSGLWLAVTIATLSYGGVEAVAMTAAESRQPDRDIPRATRRVVLRLVLFYVLATGIIVAIVPWTRASEGGGITKSPFVLLFEVAGIPAAAGIMNLVVLTAALSAANTTLYLASRTVHSLALDGLAPGRLAATSSHGSPVGAVLVSTIGLAVAALAAALSPGDVFPLMLGIGLFSGMITWLLVFAGHWAFRRRRTAEGLDPAPFRLPGAPVTTALAAAFVVSVLITTAFTAEFGAAWKVGSVFTALLCLCWPLVRARRRAWQLAEANR